jgi:hypothetical protein
MGPITVKVPGEGQPGHETDGMPSVPAGAAREQLSGAVTGLHSASDAGTIDAMMTLIMNWSASHGHGAPSHPGQSFAEIGFDSVSAVELTHFLESELRLDLDQTLLWTYTTFGTLARHLADGVGSRETGAAVSQEAPIAEAANW